MDKGGTYNIPQAARTVRYAGLIIPLLLTLYGYLYDANIIVSPHYKGFGVLTLISVAWMIVGIWQFIVPAKGSVMAGVRIALYHALAAAYLLFITGIVSPFIVFWVVLMIASFLYFDRRGILLSVVAFMVTVCVDMIVWGTADATSIPYDMAVLAAVLVSGLIIMSINRAMSIDQSELQRSHEQEVLQRDRILTIVNNLTDAIISTDKNNIIRVYNAASLDLLDTNESLNGHHIDVVLPLVTQSNEPISISSLMQKATTATVHDDVWYRFDDNERLRLEISISPIKKTFHRAATGQDGHILIMRDITKAKSLEEERDEFISVVSHELRTPITVVEGALSNLGLMLEKTDIGKNRLQEAVASAHDQTMYLAKMVNDLSALSRAERGTADKGEIIDVHTMMKSLYDTYAPEAEKKHLMFDLDITGKTGSVEASRLYLEELLQNFITNAIKYTRSGSVKISAHRKADTIVFSVADTGIGISKTEQDKIFDKFYRSEDYRTRETGGTGLGLYVVTKLASKLQTTVTLTSRLNHGSTFSFHLPLYTPPNKR